MKTASKNPRRIAALSVMKVINNKEQLNAVISFDETQIKAEDRSLYREICYVSIRYYGWIKEALKLLLKKPLPEKDALAYFVLVTGIAQIEYTRIPPHAALNETVETVRKAGFPKYANLTNAIMHNFIRRKDEIVVALENNWSAKYSYPEWLIDKIKSTYGNKTQSILEAGNVHPPMWIRVNTKKCKTDDYLKLLEIKGIQATKSDVQEGAIKIINPVSVDKLPLFKTGAIFVQDIASQKAAHIIPIKTGDTVLDCCCAPGGKTTNILELHSDLKDLVAMDNDKKRLSRVHENLERLKLKANVIFGDACADPKSWSPYEEYDAILLDAPCTATGVIRRHPDIKWIRTEKDIQDINIIQKKIIRNVWNLVKKGGYLLYTTCSILEVENKSVIKEFLNEYKDATLVKIIDDETPDNPGLQMLPGENEGDGFYYALIQKSI